MDTSVSLLERAARRADRAAWERLTEIYAPLLHGWLRRYDVPPSDADDLVQEVLLHLARALPDFQHSGRTGAFRCWLKRVLVNRLRTYWSDRQRRSAALGTSDVLQRLEQLEDPAGGLSRLWDRQHDEHIARALLAQVRPHVEPKTWDAFERTALAGESPAEVARELGMSPNAVCAAKCRVLNLLRREGRGLLG